MHSQEVRARFAGHYLYSGNASESAREVGIEERTGRDWAAELSDDPEFAERRRKLRDQEIEEAARTRALVRSKSLERFLSETGGIEVKKFGLGEDAQVVLTDKRHEYGKLALEAEKVALHRRRLDAELKGEIATPGKTEVHVHPTPAAAARIAEESAGNDGEKPCG